MGQSKLKGSEQSTLDVINDGTVLKADQNLNVQADNITVVSGEITSGADTTLTATQDITLATAQDIHQTSNTSISGTTRTAGVSYGTSYGEENRANVKVGLNVSKGLAMLLLEENVKASLKGEHIAGTLMLGSVRSSALNLLPRAIVKMRSQYPELKSNLRISLSTNLITDVAAGRLDAAIVAEHVGFETQLRWSPFFERTFVAHRPKRTKLL